jgi:hypothetical protein
MHESRSELSTYLAKMIASVQELPKEDAIEQGKHTADQAVASTKTPAELAAAYFQGILASK